MGELKFFVVDGLLLTEILLLLVKVYKESAPAFSSVKKWVTEVKPS